MATERLSMRKTRSRSRYQSADERGKTRHLEREKRSDAAVRHVLCQALEARALVGGGSGPAEIFVDDVDGIINPAQMQCALAKRVLPVGGFAVLPHLPESRLAKIDNRLPLQMNAVNLVGHRGPPRRLADREDRAVRARPPRPRRGLESPAARLSSPASAGASARSPGAVPPPVPSVSRAASFTRDPVESSFSLTASASRSRAPTASRTGRSPHIGTIGAGVRSVHAIGIRSIQPRGCRMPAACTTPFERAQCSTGNDCPTNGWMESVMVTLSESTDRIVGV